MNVDGSRHRPKIVRNLAANLDGASCCGNRVENPADAADYRIIAIKFTDGTAAGDGG